MTHKNSLPLTITADVEGGYGSRFGKNFNAPQRSNALFFMEYLSHHQHQVDPLPLDTLAAVQLLELFRDEDHDVDRIVEFISQDPELTAETLKRCNNANFRGVERITDIFEAVSRLGYYELYSIITASLGAHVLLPDTSHRNSRPSLIK